MEQVQVRLGTSRWPSFSWKVDRVLVLLYVSLSASIQFQFVLLNDKSDQACSIRTATT